MTTLSNENHNEVNMESARSVRRLNSIDARGRQARLTFPEQPSYNAV